MHDLKCIPWQNPDVCVYTLAPKQNAVVLVEAKVNSVKKPFLYQQQRLTATRCYLMHYVVYEKALRALQQTSKRSAEDLLREVLFLHSTGRCGSTLLSKLLDNGPSMVSVSEPDVFSALSIALIENTISERDFLQVARAASWHLAYRFGHHPSGKVARAVALKTRSFVLPHADLLHKAVPEAKVRHKLFMGQAITGSMYSRWSLFRSSVFLTPHPMPLSNHAEHVFVSRPHQHH